MANYTAQKVFNILEDENVTLATITTIHATALQKKIE